MERISILVVEMTWIKGRRLSISSPVLRYRQGERSGLRGRSEGTARGSRTGLEPNVIVMEASLPDDGYRMAETISTSYPGFPLS